MKKRILALVTVILANLVFQCVPIASAEAEVAGNIKNAELREIITDSIIFANGNPNAIYYGEMVKLTEDYGRAVATAEDNKLFVPEDFAKKYELSGLETKKINGTDYVSVEDIAAGMGLQGKAINNMIILSKDSSVFAKAERKEKDLELLFGIYVSPDGAETAAGTIDKPIASMESAKAKAKGIVSRLGFLGDSYTVYFRGGIYEMQKSVVFDGTDSAPEGCTLIYDAYPGEEPQFDGSLTLTGSQLQKVESGSVYDRLPAAAKGHVYSIDLEQFGYVPGTEDPNDQYVFYGGQRFTLARWPNYTDALTDKGVKTNATAADPSVSTTIKDVDKVKTWATATEPWMNASFIYTWSNQNYTVNIDPDTGIIATNEKPQYVPIGNGKTYYMYNLLEELDVEGEYFIDRKTNTFYIYPFKMHVGDGSFKTNTINIGTLKNPMIHVQNAKNLAFRRLTLQNSVGALVKVENGDRIEVAGCTLRNTAGLGVELRPATNTVVKSNDIYNTGDTAVYVEGGNLYEVELSGNEVVNNRIYDVHRGINDNYYTGYGGYVAHNEVSRTSEQFVSGIVGGATYEYNEVGDTGTRRVADSGTMYTYSYVYVPERTIRNNYFHDTTGTMSVIYFDNNSFGARCYGNIFYRTSRPFFSNGGENNIWNNNLSIDQQHSEYGDQMFQLKAAAKEGFNWDPTTHSMLKDNGTHYKVTLTDRAPNINWEKWKTAFPYFYNVYWNQKYVDLPYNAYVQNNVSVRSGGFSVDEDSQKVMTVNGNLEYNTAEDIGFVDYENQNFNLRDDSVVYKDNPEIEKFDYFDKIGLYTDEYRTELPKWDAESFNMLMPANKATDIDAKEVVFKWENLANTRKFRFLMATDAEFENVIRDEIVYGTNYTVKNLRYDESRYYWKVVAMNNNMKNFPVNAILEPETKYFSFTTAVEEIVEIKAARDAIANAEKTATQINEGDKPGEHREGTKAMLDEAVNVFKEFVETKNYSQREMDKAITKFNANVQGLNARKINETITLDEQIKILGNWTFQPNVAFVKEDGIEFQRTADTDNYSGGIETPIENYQTLQFDTSFDISNGGWIYYAARASQTNGSYSNTTLYMVVVNNQGLELQRWGSGSRVYIQYFGDEYILNNNERYSIEFGAVDDENGNVRVTFKVNGKTMIDWVDDTSDKITDKGCFTIYESKPQTLLKIMPYTGNESWKTDEPYKEGNRVS